MQELSKMINQNQKSKSTECKSSDDTRPFVLKMVDWSNDEVGTLDKRDGIECEICKNKGIVYSAKADDAITTITPCKCMAKRNSVKYARQSGLGSLLERKDFVTDTPWRTEIKRIAAEYIQGDHTHWFCMLGQSGAGKTHICSAIAKTLIDRGLETRYVVWNTFVRELKNDLYDKVGKREMLFKFQKMPVLYIDDLFKSNRSDADIGIAFDLINYRYNNNLITIITSELSMSELMSLDSAIAGRIKQKCGTFFLEITKDDEKNYRLTGNIF